MTGPEALRLPRAIAIAGTKRIKMRIKIKITGANAVSFGVL